MVDRKIHSCKYFNVSPDLLDNTVVTVAGIGSVGSIVIDMLARLNVKLRIIDQGRINEDDLETHAIFNEKDINKFKAKQTKKYVESVNKSLKVKTFHELLTKDNLFLLDSDIVVDCTNDLALSKEICRTYHKKRPLLIIKVDGENAIVYAKGKDDPTILRMSEFKSEKSEKPLFSSCTHMVASIVVSEVLKMIVDPSFKGKLIEVDAWKPKIKVTKV